MKASKVLLVALALSLSLSEIRVCEAQYLEIMKGLGTVIKVVLKAQDALEYLQNKENQTINEHAVQNEKLDNITKKIQTVEKEMMENFKKLLKKLEQIPGETVTQYTASKFERYMQTIEKNLEDLVEKKAKVNKGSLVLDGHFKQDVDSYNENLKKYKDKIEVIMNGKELSLDFLAQVKKNANVCTDKMTQLQLLDSFRALYVDTVSRYLMARHIVISLWESSDKTTHEDKKRELNEDVRKDLETYSKRFQKLMSNASREFQLCDQPKEDSEYIMHNTAKKSRSCYLTDDSQPDTIVSYGPHFGGGKHCYDYISLRPATARPGYVVVGAKIERNANILFIRIIEGKLLPNGVIDPKSVTYDEKPQPGIGEKVVKFDYRYTIFDITETIAPDDRVITGLRFAETDDKRIYLEVNSTEFNLDKGILAEDTSRPEPHKKGLTQFKVRPFDSRDDEVVRDPVGNQPVKPDQYLQFAPGGKIRVHPYLDMEDVYPTPLTLLSGASFYVRQVQGTEGYLSIRLHTFNIVPHVTKIDFELNEDFADVLKDI